MSLSMPSPNARRLFSRGFVLLLVAQLCFGFAHSSFLLLPKYMVNELAASASQIGWAMACFGVIAVVCLPPIASALSTTFVNALTRAGRSPEVERRRSASLRHQVSTSPSSGHQVS